jgi:hypothetical protein
MSDETFEDEASVDDDALADDDLGDEAIDEDLEGDDDLADADDDGLEIGLEDDIDVDAVVADDTVARVVEAPAAKPKGDDEEDEDVVDLDEELHPDDVEVPLDALLKERTAAATLEDEEEEIEEEEPESDASPDGPTRIVPRRAGEFLCSSCFLVLPRNQLQDEERMLCRDCA